MMSLAEILTIAFGVSVDAFAVSVGGALGERSGHAVRNALYAALFFGGFQLLMPVGGFFAAHSFCGIFDRIEPWLAFGLLTWVGGRMIFDGFRRDGLSSETTRKAGFFTPRALFVPAIATSLDAFAVGAGLAFAGLEIAVPAAAMGVVTALSSACGVLLGRRIGSAAGERTMTVAGGVAILLIGVKISLFR